MIEFCAMLITNKESLYRYTYCRFSETPKNTKDLAEYLKSKIEIQPVTEVAWSLIGLSRPSV